MANDPQADLIFAILAIITVTVHLIPPGITVTNYGDSALNGITVTVH